jgi:hypothetical protein
MSALGLGDAELFDLTLASALFTALAIIEPISAAIALNTERPGADVAVTRDGQFQSALREKLAV